MWKNLAGKSRYTAQRVFEATGIVFLLMSALAGVVTLFFGPIGMFTVRIASATSNGNDSSKELLIASLVTCACMVWAGIVAILLMLSESKFGLRDTLYIWAIVAFILAAIVIGIGDIVALRNTEGSLAQVVINASIITAALGWAVNIAYVVIPDKKKASSFTTYTD